MLKKEAQEVLMGLQQCIRKKRAGGALLGDYDTMPHHIRCNSRVEPIHSLLAVPLDYSHTSAAFRVS